MNDRNNQYAQSMFTNMQNSEGGFFNNNPPPKLGEKSITENGTYTAKEDKLDGYSSVTTDVSSVNDFVYYCCGSFASGAYPGAPASLNHSTVQFAVYVAKSDEVTIPKTVYTYGSKSLALTEIIIDGTINKLNITDYSYAVAFTFLAGNNFNGFTVKGNDVVPTGDSITAGKWYNALLQNDTITVEESNGLLGITILSE